MCVTRLFSDLNLQLLSETLLFSSVQWLLIDHNSFSVVVWHHFCATLITVTTSLVLWVMQQWWMASVMKDAHSLKINVAVYCKQYGYLEQLSQEWKTTPLLSSKSPVLYSGQYGTLTADVNTSMNWISLFGFLIACFNNNLKLSQYRATGHESLTCSETKQRRGKCGDFIALSFSSSS